MRFTVPSLPEPFRLAPRAYDPPYLAVDTIDLEISYWHDFQQSMSRYEIHFINAEGRRQERTLEIPDETLYLAPEPALLLESILLNAMTEMGVPREYAQMYLTRIMRREEQYRELNRAAQQLSEGMQRLGVTAREAGENMQRAFSMLPTAQEASSVLEAEHKHRYGSHIVIFEAPCPGCGNDVTWQQTMGYEGRPDTFQIWDEECCGGLP